MAGGTAATRDRATPQPSNYRPRVIKVFDIRISISMSIRIINSISSISNIIIIIIILSAPRIPPHQPRSHRISGVASFRKLRGFGGSVV